MLSWLEPGKPPPDIPTMQRLLLAAQPNAYPGDQGWIGVPDAVTLLDLIHDGARDEAPSMPQVFMPPSPSNNSGPLDNF